MIFLKNIEKNISRDKYFVRMEKLVIFFLSSDFLYFPTISQESAFILPILNTANSSLSP